MSERPPRLKLLPTLAWSLVMGMVLGFGLAGIRSVNSDFMQTSTFCILAVFFTAGMVGVSHLKHTFLIWATVCGPTFLVSLFLPIASETARPIFALAAAFLGLAALYTSIFAYVRRKNRDRADATSS